LTATTAPIRLLRNKILTVDNEMNHNKPILIALIAFLFSGTATAASADFRQLTPIQNIKSYALAACLNHGFQTNKAFQKESNVAARALVDFGAFGVAAYKEADDLARHFLAKKYEAENGEDLTILKCIDLFHSRELDVLAQKHQRLRFGTQGGKQSGHE
jgi:hypothetical protein